MDLPQWNIPVARLPTIVTTQISGHLPFPVPVEPISSSNGNLLSTDTLPSSEVLNAVAAALENTDISYVYVYTATRCATRSSYSHGAMILLLCCAGGQGRTMSAYMHNLVQWSMPYCSVTSMHLRTLQVSVQIPGSSYITPGLFLQQTSCCVR